MESIMESIDDRDLGAGHPESDFHPESGDRKESNLRKKSVVLLSGGLDSAANLAFCREMDDPVLAITVDYGQKAATRELEAAERWCRYYDLPHQIVDLKWLGKMGGNSLTEQDRSIPQLRVDELNDVSITRKSGHQVWVPNRNGVLIHVAAAYAERMDASQVVVGFNREEAATFPDNSVDYLTRVNEALAFSTSNQVQVSCYTLLWDKRQIVAELKKLSKKFPFEMIWSCYEGGDKPCERCESCQRLRRAMGLA